VRRLPLSSSPRFLAHPPLAPIFLFATGCRQRTTPPPCHQLSPPHLHHRLKKAHFHKARAAGGGLIGRLYVWLSRPLRAERRIVLG